MSDITPQYLTLKKLLHVRPFAIDDCQREYKWVPIGNGIFDMQPSGASSPSGVPQ
jgi:hypothetical protein